jgi:hypothetical protein
LSGATILNYVGANGGASVVVDANSKVSFWVGGTLTCNQPMDSDCGARNGLAAAPQLANIGITNCPNTYTGN